MFLTTRLSSIGGKFLTTSIRLSSTLINNMEKHQVVPDVIKTAPCGVAKIVYPTGLLKVDLGNVLTPTQVKDIPNVEWEADQNQFYTLCMTDPDAPR